MSLRLLVLPLLLLMLVGGSVLLGERLFESMLFRPVTGAEIQPERLGIEGEDVFLQTEDGVRIHGFWLPVENAQKALLFLHGNGGNASFSLPRASQFLRFGVSVLVLDYRGYGLSEGVPTEVGVYQDAQAGLEYLVEVRGFPEDRILVLGQSLGGAVAVDLAQEKSLGGVILESTFDSLAGVVHSRVPFVDRLLSGRFDSDRKILLLESPILFLHGDRDGTVPLESGKRLFALAPEPKEFVTIEGARHNDVAEVGGRLYFDRVGEFVASMGAR